MDDDRIERALRAGRPDEGTYTPLTALDTRRVQRSRPRVSMSGLAGATATVLAIVVAVVILRMASPRGSADLLSQIRAAGGLRVAITEGPPQVATPTGTAGFDVDVAEAIGQRLGIPVRVDLVDPAVIEAGHWDARWDLALDSVVSTAQRAAALDVGDGYYARAGAVVVPADSPIQAPADLAGTSVCVVRGGLAERWLAGALELVDGTVTATPTVTTVPSEDPAACLASLRAGTVDAYVTDWRYDVPSVTADLRILDAAPFVGVAGAAVDAARPDSDTLLSEIDRVIAGMRADGTLAGLSQRRFAGQDLTILPSS